MFDRFGRNMLRQTAGDDRKRVTEITSIVIANTVNSVLTSVMLGFFYVFLLCGEKLLPLWVRTAPNNSMQNNCHSFDDVD
jgi:hypothetical protein